MFIDSKDKHIVAVADDDDDDDGDDDNNDNDNNDDDDDHKVCKADYCIRRLLLLQ